MEPGPWSRGSVFVSHMVNTILIIAGVAFVAAAGVLVLSRRRRGGALGARAGRDSDGPATVADTAADLERSKLIVHSLLKGVTENIEALVGDVEAYDSSLEGHKRALNTALTIEGIKELERVLVAEMEALQKDNGRYRTQLEESRATSREQQGRLERLQTDLSADFLTEVPNRRSLDKRLEEEVSRSKRYKGTFSMLVIDIDHFKKVNDRYGHLVGDRVLKAVAKLLDTNKRSTDYLARYGGEEFVLILPELTVDKAKIVAEKLRKKVASSKFHFESTRISVTVSVGLGEIVAARETVEDFFDRVDKALYRAKEQGRNQCEPATRIPKESRA